jgi:hypothetical protein
LEQVALNDRFRTSPLFEELWDRINAKAARAENSFSDNCKQGSTTPIHVVIRYRPVKNVPHAMVQIHVENRKNPKCSLVYLDDSWSKQGMFLFHDL